MSENLGIGKLITSKQYKDAIHIAVAPVIAGENLKPNARIAFIRPGVVGKSKKPCGFVDPCLEEDVREGEQFWMWMFPGSITSLRHDWTHPAFSGEEEKIVPARRGRRRRSSPQPVKYEDWRKNTQVENLVKEMLETRDYSSLGILGDALEDAGCPDSELIENCRNGYDYEGIMAAVYVCQAAGGEYLKAVERVEAIAQTCDITLNRLMTGADEKARHGYNINMGDNEMGYFHSDIASGEFWELYNQITGKSEKNHRHFFSCSC